MLEWFRTHPYGATAIIISLILAGIFIVRSRAPVAVDESRTVAWGGASDYFFDPVSNAPNNSGNDPQTIYSAVQNGPPFYYDPSAAAAPLDEGGNAFDFNTFLATLSQQQGSTAPTDTDTGLNAYSFIPSGLISAEERAETQTPTQRALYNYGNAAGSPIQSFEFVLRSAPQILKDQFEDSNNPAKNAALVDLADGLAYVGESLESIQNVPPEVAPAHTNLVESYKTMGEYLARIPEIQSEQAVLDAMLIYNQKVEEYVKDYVALAILFSAHGVKFTGNDPGSVFTFTASF